MSFLSYSLKVNWPRWTNQMFDRFWNMNDEVDMHLHGQKCNLSIDNGMHAVPILEVVLFRNGSIVYWRSYMGN